MGSESYNTCVESGRTGTTSEDCTYYVARRVADGRGGYELSLRDREGNTVFVRSHTDPVSSTCTNYDTRLIDPGTVPDPPASPTPDPSPSPTPDPPAFANVQAALDEVAAVWDKINAVDLEEDNWADDDEEDAYYARLDAASDYLCQHGSADQKQTYCPSD